MSIRSVLFLIFTLFIHISRLTAEDFYIAEKIESPIVIDGKLNESDWVNTGVWANSFKLVKSGSLASQQTEFKILYDVKNIYIGIKCEEVNIAYLKCTTNAHDGDVWNDDCAEIFLEPEKSANTMGFHFIVNPAGVFYDEKRKDSLSESGWNASIEIKTSVESGYWIVEFAIPLETINAEGKMKTIWGMNICRERYAADPNEISSWSFAPKGFCFSNSFGNLLFRGSDFSSSLKEQYVQPLIGKITSSQEVIKKMSSLKVMRYEKEIRKYDAILNEIKDMINAGELTPLKLKLISNKCKENTNLAQKTFNYIQIDSLLDDE